ncbi:phosphoenolpyruvate--protein phosphotransferase [Cohnella sp. GbtcB17]|uniref:phosphoenolpyruvate--protein phosphotransferase n=1 Tax=Cohnella sp. GbtcB17 TaxID=2824762 RepID=UPI001C301D08|nr:phosphoenolpyruvate--protein phosphotransferase [Cohnella sp. GbtcB17]
MILQGVPASAGYAIGKARIIREEVSHQPVAKIDPSTVAGELERLEAALARAADELSRLHAKWIGDGREQEAEIFEGHLYLIRDEELTSLIRSKIADDYFQAEFAVREAAEDIASRLSRLDDPYLQLRSADIRDIGDRICRCLSNKQEERAAPGSEREILIAEDLLPTYIAQLDNEVVVGFATSLGGATSHTAIIARSLGLPAVIGAVTNLERIEEGQTIIVDGVEGKVIVDPSEEDLASYGELRERYLRRLNELRAFGNRPTRTSDGHLVELTANIGSVKEASSAADCGAEGIGLFRTEFLFMERNDLPDEDEQFEVYRDIVQAIGPEAPVVIRTMDIGGDKELPALNLPKEQNPFLGFRAIRISLEKMDLFKTQLRAILRASALGNISIMFPMISTMQELSRAMEAVEAAKRELAEQGVPFDRAVPIGIMIEVPAAAILADRFAKVVDFFSIGTNDLVQYTMAADRMNAKVMHMNNGLEPAVLRLIYNVIQAAVAERIPVGMCGEMAGQPLAIPLLLGMGLQKFSVSGGSILATRELISRIDRREAQELLKDALELDDPDKIKACVEKWYANRQASIMMEVALGKSQ